MPTQVIKEHIESLSQQINEKLRKLEARTWLAKIKEDVTAWIKKRKILDAALKDTPKNLITTQTDKIAEQVVSKTLRDQFSKEFKQLNSTGLKVEMHTTASLGASCSKIILNGNPDISVGEILSEGESRCVALTVFLAELATTENKSAIVFDDPISSLDHDHRTEVAKRLAEERKHRQVIVLTHDIVFLNALRWECKEDLVNYCSVIRVEDNVGLVRDELPMIIQPVEDSDIPPVEDSKIPPTKMPKVKAIKNSIEKLNKRLESTGKLDGTEWEYAATCLAAHLRLMWEQAVENVISPVYARFSDKVQHRNIIQLTVFDEDNCGKMRKAYTRLSLSLHATANLNAPRPESLQKEINELKEWFDCIKKRQNEVAK